jgi:hypothetical protein
MRCGMGITRSFRGLGAHGRKPESAPKGAKRVEGKWSEILYIQPDARKS